MSPTAILVCSISGIAILIFFACVVDEISYWAKRVERIEKYLQIPKHFE
jgi:hypothetical protein